ncbi:MAG TPA: hypothetical protein VM490_12150, partial [Armatimonadaceae bacterium]|nr:hypothetical protein [Armatimonadaceae bacterium]
AAAEADPGISSAGSPARMTMVRSDGSATAAAGAAAAAAEAAADSCGVGGSFVPQLPQKRLPGALVLPQSGQTGSFGTLLPGEGGVASAGVMAACS